MIYSVGDGAENMTVSLALGFSNAKHHQDLIARKNETIFETAKTMTSDLQHIIPNPQSIKNLFFPIQNSTTEIPQWSDFENENQSTDDSVTLVGHTDETYSNIGGKTAEEIACGLAAKYGNNKDKLTEIILVACESATKRNTICRRITRQQTNPFAQELADEMFKAGFTNDKLKVLAVKSPENSVAMRVTVTTQAGISLWSLGKVSAFAYMNKETMDYEEANQKGARPKKHDLKILMQQTDDETYQEAFRRSATIFKPTSKGYKSEAKKVAEPKSPPPPPSQIQEQKNYLDKILNNRGPLKRLLYSIYPTPFFTKVLLNELRAANEQEQQVYKEFNDIKTAILPDLKGIKATMDYKWSYLITYMTCNHQDVDNRKNTWQKVVQYKENYYSSKQKLGYVGTDQSSSNTKQTSSFGSSAKDQQIADLVNKPVSFFYDKLIIYEENLGNVDQKKNNIKGQIVKFIEKYKNDNTNKNGIHEAKIRVMDVLKNYIENPTDKNWDAITKETQDERNNGWDQGYFSKVSKIHDEIVKLTIENQLPSKPSSP